MLLVGRQEGHLARKKSAAVITGISLWETVWVPHLTCSKTWKMSWFNKNDCCCSYFTNRS